MSYGKLTKRIVFTETEHNHAKLVLRLRHDGLSQSEFFRGIVRAYIEGDEKIQDFAQGVGKLSKSRKNLSKKKIEEGHSLASDLGFSEKDVENIFDLIAEEHPDL